MSKKLLLLISISMLLTIARASCSDESADEHDDDDDAQCEPVTSFEFEVIGKVQGVYFRKHTQEMAQKLALVGWVMNTQEDTVVGKVQGSQQNIAQITCREHWLRNVGSPKSKIEKMNRKNYKILQKADFTEFEIRK